MSRFGDACWNLSSLSAHGHSAGCAVNWDDFPSPALLPSMRRAAWILVNLPTPEELLERKASCRVKWPSPESIKANISHWRKFAEWLTARDIRQLSEVTEEDLEDYAAHVAGWRLSANTSTATLYALSLLWGAAPHLPDSDRLTRPPWEKAEGAMRDYLPTASRGTGKTTMPIHPAVMSPLLIWALRFVDDFADDILAAWHERQRLDARIQTEPDAEGRRRANELVDHYLTAKQALPGGIYQGQHFTARTFMAGMAGCTPRQIVSAIERARRRGAQLQVGFETPLDVPMKGRIHSQPWRPHINYHEAGTSVRLLATACMITILYLSGMRPGECLELQVGCCPDPPDDGSGVVRYEIFGNTFKGVRDEDGRSLPGGKARELPWTVIPPVVAAIRVLERIAEGRWLFPVNTSWNIAPSPRQRSGELLTAGGANERIADFISYINELCDQLGLAPERIPDDPEGRVVVKRFRKTVAWHIARLPGGRIALAIQYGHLRASAITDGYSSRAAGGLRRVLDIETARAMADYLDDVAERLKDGEGVSGPAARRMIKAVRDAKLRFEGMFLSPRDADDLLEESQFHVYDNPEAFLTCNYDPAKALCHPERTGRTQRNLSPAIDRCDPACANIARTDTHIEALQREIAQLQAEIADSLTPTPLRERLKQRVAALRGTVARHQRTRLVTPSPDHTEEHQHEPEP
jgi:integrase